MVIRSFLKLVEIQTKVASVIPLLLGSVYTLYRYNTFNLKNFILMFISLLCIDMATTTNNNYQDYRRAKRKYGYGYEEHNAIVRYNLNNFTVLTVLFTLLACAIISGFLLFLNTNIIVLILGAISFAIGILYTYGPVPISRTPFGEVFSGTFMGLILTFIAIYIHVPDQRILTLAINGEQLSFILDIKELSYIVLLCIPSITGIANIMLANNICDLEEDVENKRYTLVVYIGKTYAIKLFRHLYYLAFISIAFAIVLGALPRISVLVLGTFILVNRNIKVFLKKQTKKDTFIVSVKNFVIINLSLAFTIAIAVVMKYYAS